MAGNCGRPLPLDLSFLPQSTSEVPLLHGALTVFHITVPRCLYLLSGEMMASTRAEERDFANSRARMRHGGSLPPGATTNERFIFHGR